MNDDLTMNDVFSVMPGDLLLVVGGCVVKTTSGNKLAPNIDDTLFVIASHHPPSRNGVKSTHQSMLLLHLKTCSLIKVASSRDVWWLKKL